jgi:mannose-6-phosphate isomerase-like protein (cupin superfamily)
MIKRNHTCATEVRQNMRGGNGSVTVTHFWGKGELKARTRLCARLTLEPGSSIGFHEHVNEEEVYIVLRGQGLIEENGQKIPVSVGDSILTGDGAGHAVEAVGSEPLEMLAFIVQY